MPSESEGDYGPPVQLFPVSGLTGEGLDDLIEGLALQSEIMDLRKEKNFFETRVTEYQVGGALSWD